MPTDDGKTVSGNEHQLGRGDGVLSSGSGAGSGWRVILVGRTGLDQVLRRVAGVELIRTRDSFDAIGELSDPIDDASPARAAVLVAKDAEPRGEELGRFVEALRMVDASVKVIRVGDRHPMYDGCVGADASGDRVMGVIRDAVAMPRVVVPKDEDDDSLEAVVSEVETETAPVESNVQTEVVEQVEEPADEQIEADHAESHAAECARNEAHDASNVREVMKLHQRVMSDVGLGGMVEKRDASSAGDLTDECVIRAMGEGRSVLDDALALIAARTGRDGWSFVTGQSDNGVAVSAGGKVFGSLVCEDLAWARGNGARAMSEHASWLGSWLRLEAQQRELRLAAFTDELTGAWNRRYFTRFLDAAIEQARGARRTLTLLYFDIDNFKGYNDRHGHAAGDEILMETVRLLESVIRPGDKVCRIGGDEFVVIFYEPKGPRDLGSMPPESIYDIATRFQKQICNHNFPKLGDEACGTLTVSGGLASYPWDGSDGDSLLALADELALQSKRSGKNVITMGRGAEGVCRVDHDRD
jgi:diguanylate cyclase (GGDEF)-like protein